MRPSLFSVFLSVIGNQSVPIQLAQCRFPELATHAKILVYSIRKQFFSNSTRKQLLFEMTKMLIAV